MEKEDIEKARHLYSGSVAKYWANCHGWASLAATTPSEEAGIEAIRGTALHTGILERKVRAEIEFLLNGKEIPSNEVLYADIPNWPEDGPELAEAFWQAFFKNVLEEIITGKTIYIEHKLFLSEELDAGGTADVVVIYRNDKNQVVLVVGDLKTGYREVKPTDEQLLFYLSAGNELAQKKGLTIDVFKAFIFQPTDSEAYSEHIFSKSKIGSATKRYFQAIAQSKKEDPKFKVGDWCRFCRVQASCKTYNKYLDRQLEVVPTNGLPSVETLPDETLVNIWLHSDRIEGYLSAVKKHIIRRFREGRPLSGLKLVDGVAKRRWRNEETTKEVLRAAGIDPVIESVVNLGEAEKRLKNGGHSKKDIDSIMYTLTDKPKPPPKLVVESDPRPAIDIVDKDLLVGYDEVSETL